MAFEGFVVAFIVLGIALRAAERALAALDLIA